MFLVAEIFILDEPTSALDPIAEMEVFKNFESLTKKKTTIFISHRMASAKIADRILVFKDGEIIEEGTHKELMLLQGEYFTLFETQSRLYNYNSSKEILG